ncbi:HIRAN domain-containing protein [methanogenic archaeon mixed culture ISO4-G1]|nr:HIRAN domain-containing protein [methanogenic archaeon mixed culture ISO4-G1]
MEEEQPKGLEIEIQPLKPISLLVTRVAGVMYRDDPWFATDGLYHHCPLELRREPENDYDPFAVMVMRGDEMIGYIPRERNIVIANLMDAGRELRCRVCAMDRDDYSIDLWIEVLMDRIEPKDLIDGKMKLTVI